MRIVFVILTALPLLAIEACTSNETNPDGTSNTDASTTRDGTTPTEEEDGGTTTDGSGTTDAKNDTTSDSGPVSGKKVFVTSLVYTGMVGGTTGADGKCTSRAFTANLPGTFKAWISTAGTDDAKTRLAHSNGAYVRVDGQLIASNWTAFASNSHQAAIDIDEMGAKLAANEAVWTNTNPDGSSKGADHCLSWASPSNGEKGAYGVVDAKDTRWTDAAIGACAPQAHLYCVEQ